MRKKLKPMIDSCIDQISFKTIDLLVWSSMSFIGKLLKKSKN